MMEIKTRFSIGDSVWAIVGGEARQGEVEQVNAVVRKAGRTEISYFVTFDHRLMTNYPERSLGANKEELRASL